MYVRLTNGIPKRYTIGQLRRDNPNTSFPKVVPTTTLADYGVYPLMLTDRPDVDYTLNVTESTPQKINGVWTQVWEITAASEEEIASRVASLRVQAESQRAEAYRQESDPLFFKWHRGSATEQEWLDKVAEIKARYPDPA